MASTDRSKELRMLMKQKQQKTAISVPSQELSGKEKLKLLKQMRDKQKEPVMSIPAPVQSNQDKPIKQIVPKALAKTSEPPPESSLPSSFFDEAPAAVSATVNALPSYDYGSDSDNEVSEANNAEMRLQQLISSSVAQSTKQVDETPVEETSALPAGFFDSEITATAQDSIDKPIAQDSSLSEFFEEIEAVEAAEAADEDPERQLQNDTKRQEIEDEALQLAYKARLAAMFMRKSNAGDVSTAAAAELMAKEAESVINSTVIGIVEGEIEERQKLISAFTRQKEVQYPHEPMECEDSEGQSQPSRKRPISAVEGGSEGTSEDEEEDSGYDMDNIDWMARGLM